MNSREFKARAETLRAEGVDVEDWLGGDAATIARWEQGLEPVPRVRARQIRWLRKYQENRNRMAAAAQVECSWKTKHDDQFKNAAPGRPTIVTQEEANKFLDERAAHRLECQVCAANERWEQQNLLNIGPFPVPGFWGSVLGVMGRVPAPLIPAALGAAVLGGIVAVRFVIVAAVLLFRFPGLSESALALGAGILTVAAAAAGGASGGLVIPVTRPMLRRLGAVGDYVTGILIMEAYMWSLAVLMPVVVGAPMLEDVGDWKFFAGFAAVFGLFGAFVYRRNERKERPRHPRP